MGVDYTHAAPRADVLCGQVEQQGALACPGFPDDIKVPVADLLRKQNRCFLSAVFTEPQAGAFFG